jgi:type III pantothenate kinase
VARVLTVDLGNSRLKACLWEGGGVQARHVGDAADLALFTAWLLENRAPRVGLASVAGLARTEELARLLARFIPGVERAPQSSLENLCRSPERVGEDRLYAALGAAGRVGRSALVVNAGTALTVDLVRVDGARLLFEGGVIAPGPSLLARALHDGTARLPLVQPRPGVPVLGRVSEEALESGIVHGFRGAAAHLVAELAREPGFAAAPVVLAGGARSFLLEPQPFSAREIVVEPDLVQLGLLAALEATGARP